MTKIKSVILALMFLSLAIACNKTKEKINEVTEFDLNYSSNVAVPSSSLNANLPVDFVSPEINTESAAKFSAEGTSQDLIDQIKLTKFHITNNSGNLDFLKSFTVYIKASGLSEAAIASKTLVPAGQTTIAGDIADVNLKNYLFKDKIQFRISAVANASISTNQDLKLDQTFRVFGKKL